MPARAKDGWMHVLLPMISEDPILGTSFVVTIKTRPSTVKHTDDSLEAYNQSYCIVLDNRQVISEQFALWHAGNHKPAGIM